jgi:hypothetical protein
VCDPDGIASFPWYSLALAYCSNNDSSPWGRPAGVGVPLAHLTQAYDMCQSSRVRQLCWRVDITHVLLLQGRIRHHKVSCACQHCSASKAPGVGKVQQHAVKGPPASPDFICLAKLRCLSYVTPLHPLLVLCCRLSWRNRHSECAHVDRSDQLQRFGSIEGAIKSTSTRRPQRRPPHPTRPHIMLQPTRQ